VRLITAGTLSYGCHVTASPLVIAVVLHALFS
jgi:hypothetical protein